MRVLGWLVLIALPVAAQPGRYGPEAVSPEGFFGVGFSAPVNPLAGQLDAGWNLAGGIGATTEYVGVMLDAIYTGFGINHTTLSRAGFPGGSQKYWAVTVDPIFHVNRRGPLDFYITAGAGIYGQITQFQLPNSLVASFPGSTNLISSYTLYKGGANAGAGFSFDLGYGLPVKVFVEARFHHMFTSAPGASFIPVTVGVRF